MIAIGNDFGGPERQGSVVHLMLNRAMNIAAAMRDANYNNGTEAWVNPVFIVPGSVSKPDFEGYRLGHFSHKERGLVVMVAVPASVADGDGVAAFVGASLRESVRLAAAYFSKNGMSFSTLKAEKIILAIETSLKN